MTPAVRIGCDQAVVAMGRTAVVEAAVEPPGRAADYLLLPFVNRRFTIG